MKDLRPVHTLIALTPIVLALTASGCATKKYVSKQIHTVDQRVAQVQKQTNEELEKHQREISRLDEHMITTDNRLATVNTTAQQANSTAGEALQQAQTNSSAIQAGAELISAHTAQLTKLANDFNYSEVGSGDVTFAFNKWELTKDAQAALDMMIQKATAAPRTLIEVVGYTDKTGSAAYNLTLSRRRADAVARYLVKNGIPLKSISFIGLGEEQTPELLAAEVKDFNPNASKKEIHSLARRVRIRLYTPGATATAAADASGGIGAAQVQQ